MFNILSFFNDIRIKAKIIVFFACVVTILFMSVMLFLSINFPFYIARRCPILLYSRMSKTARPFVCEPDENILQLLRLPDTSGQSVYHCISFLEKAVCPQDKDPYEWYYSLSLKTKRWNPFLSREQSDGSVIWLPLPLFGLPSEEIPALEVVTVGEPPVYKASISTDHLVGRGNPTA